MLTLVEIINGLRYNKASFSNPFFYISILCSFSVNIDNTVGAIGFVSRIIPSVYPISILKVNEEGELIRNAKGLCQVCEPSKYSI